MTAPPNAACPACGSEWFTAPGITVSLTGEVTGHEAPLSCRTCGAVLGAATGAQPNAIANVRSRAARVAQAEPGVWVDWRTYPPEKAATARVHASDIRTGKIKTIGQVVGPVEVRTVRRPDGSVQVQVARAAV